MKKFLKLFVSVICSLLISGCAGNLKPENTIIETQIDSNVTIDENDRQYKAHLIYSPEGHMSLSFMEPESVSGLNFVCNGGKYEVSKGDLKGEFTLKPFSENSFAFVASEILGNLNDPQNLRLVENREGDKIYEGKINESIFRFVTDKTGKIRMLDIPEKNTTVSFI